MKLHELQEQYRKTKKLPPQGGGEMDCFYYDTEGNVKRELFNEIAEKTARELTEADKVAEAQQKFREKQYKEADKILKSIKSTTTTQFRKYYDELRRFKIQIDQIPDKTQQEEKFQELLPSIKMIRAKVIYARGRHVVTDSFVNFIDKNISFIKSDKDFDKFFLFCKYFEAVLGFLKYYEEIKKQLEEDIKRELNKQRRKS